MNGRKNERVTEYSKQSNKEEKQIGVQMKKEIEIESTSLHE